MVESSELSEVYWEMDASGKVGDANKEFLDEEKQT